MIMNVLEGPKVGVVQMRKIIGFENGETNLGHLFHFAADQKSVAGELPSAQHIGVLARCAGDSFIRRMVSFRETERPAISFRKDDSSRVKMKPYALDTQDFSKRQMKP
ncbi:hypothetical protein LXL04_013617 [Taraxacum kok-saghyz]